MPPADYRSEKMDSPEGTGRARGRWFGFLSTVPKDALDAAGYLDGSSAGFMSSLLSAEQMRVRANAAKESADLIGFWVTWHRAGGFAQLESWGWHRATIFRKIRRFRDEFGAHPDEYEFSWIKLDLEAEWSGQLVRDLS